MAYFELLASQGHLSASHEDIDDVGQTVVMDNPDTPEVPASPYDKTGADAPISLPFALVGMLIVAAGAVTLVFALKRRGKGDGDDDPSEEVTE